MIRKDKVVVMTKVAMEEARKKSRKYPASRYFPEDYVGFQMVKGVVGVTLLYALIVGGWGICTADTWMTWSFPKLWDLAIQLIVIYVFIVLATALILLLVYALRYYQAKTRIEEEEFYLKKLCRFYENEDRKRGE